jgi:Putative transposase/Transposase zinc-binding domain
MMITLLKPVPQVDRNADDEPPPRPGLEVADIFRQFGDAYREAHALPLHQLQTMRAIEVCRSAELGGHIEQCDTCGHLRPVYNSCRNRHCPKCQALAKAKWLADRQAELLPVGYFHNVFTLPHELNPLLAANQAALYTLLFRSVAKTLQACAADSEQGLGGQLGFTAVLHTWDQKLLYHVHLHCVIAGGALAFDGSRWLAARRNYLFSVRSLSTMFRDRYVRGLQKLWSKEQLAFPGQLAPLAQALAFEKFLEPVRQKDWVVYSQPPFAGPEKVLDYLSRYTHRVAISNHRLRSLEGDQVTFDYRDRRDGGRLKQLTLSAYQFIGRFLQHIVPPGFCRIRHFGFLGNRVKEERLQRCRILLGQPISKTQQLPRNSSQLLLELTGIDVTQCPRCQVGTMVVVEYLPQPCTSETTGEPQRPSHPDSS